MADPHGKEAVGPEVPLSPGTGRPSTEAGTPGGTVDPASALASLETMAKLYRSLWRLSQRQRRLIEISDAAALMRVLEARKTVLDRLKVIQPDVERAVEAWRAKGRSMPEAIRERIRARLDEINDLLKRVMAADDEDAKRLGARRATVADGLGRQRHAERAARAYGAGAPRRTGGRLDLRDETE